MEIVGWILLGILGFVLLLLLLVLFYPILYRIEIKKNESTSGKLYAIAKGNWLFGLVNFRYEYPEPAEPILKVAFFDVYGKEKNEKKKIEKKKNEKKKEESSGKPDKDNEIKEAGSSKEEKQLEEKRLEEIQLEEKQLEEVQLSEGEPSKEQSIHQKDPMESDAQMTESSEVKTSEEMQKRLSDDSNQPLNMEENQSRRKRKKEKLGDSIRRKIRHLKIKIKYFLEDFRFYYNLWNEPDTKPFLYEAIKRLLKIFKNLMPRSIRGSAVFGSSSPDVTGYVFGFYSVGSSLFPKRISLILEPDFENAVFEGQVLMKGRFNLFVVLSNLVVILLDKRLHVLKKKLDVYKRKTEKRQMRKAS